MHTVPQDLSEALSLRPECETLGTGVPAARLALGWHWGTPGPEICWHWPALGVPGLAISCHRALECGTNDGQSIFFHIKSRPNQPKTHLGPHL